MELFLVALVGLGLAGYAWVRHRHRTQRREQLFALAQRHGLTYDRADVLGVSSRRFEFFRRGDDAGVENLLYGTMAGEPVRLFDAWIVHESRDSDGNTTRRYERFTCALAELTDAWLPRIRIRPETIGSRLRDAVGGEDVQFESDEFNRAWDVRCRDRRAAYAVVDAGVMRWLLMTHGRFQFELSGREVLLISDRVPVSQFLVLHRALMQFRDRVPAVVAELYPSGGTGRGPT